MALFVDGPACTIDELSDQDAGMLDVAANSGINVSTKLRLATEEIGTELDLWLKRPQPNLELIWETTVRMEQIVVTQPLKRWETMHALELIYRDAYFSQFVDRYQAKWQQYALQTRDARESFLASGLGLVSNPVRRASPPVLSMATGPQSGGEFYASVTWVNAENQEGAASYASSIAVTDGNLMAVGATGAPANAVGFNVYAGAALNAMFRQNQVTLPVSGTFLYIPGQVTQGQLPGNGQPPDFTRTLARTILRG